MWKELISFLIGAKIISVTSLLACNLKAIKEQIIFLQFRISEDMIYLSHPSSSNIVI